MKKSACLFIIGLALHGSLGWGVGESCEDKDCDKDAGVTTATGDAAVSTQGPTAREPKPEETFITDVKAGIGGGQFDPEAAKGAYAGLPNDDSKEAALDSLKALAEEEKDTGKAKQLADLAAELEHRADYEKLDEETLRAKKAELFSKIMGHTSSQMETAQARLITKMLAEKEAEQSRKAEGSQLSTVPGQKIVRGDSRIPISVSSDKKTQFIPSKFDGIVSVSTDGGRSFTDLPEEKFGLKRNSDGTYTQSDKKTVSAGAPEAIGVIQRTGGKDPAFEYQYTNQDGKQVVGFQNSQGQWVEGNPEANSYSKANPPSGYEVKNGRLARIEQPKPEVPATTTPPTPTAPKGVPAEISAILPTVRLPIRPTTDESDPLLTPVVSALRTAIEKPTQENIEQFNSSLAQMGREYSKENPGPLGFGIGDDAVKNLVGKLYPMVGDQDVAAELALRSLYPHMMFPDSPESRAYVAAQTEEGTVLKGKDGAPLVGGFYEIKPSVVPKEAPTLVWTPATVRMGPQNQTRGIPSSDPNIYWDGSTTNPGQLGQPRILP